MQYAFAFTVERLEELVHWFKHFCREVDQLFADLVHGLGSWNARLLVHLEYFA